MNPNDLTLSEQALLVRAHTMGGYLVDNLTADDRRVLNNLAGYGLAEVLGEGAQRRYALTAAGEQLAEQIANNR
jgi:hypothetical protein